MPIEDTGWYYRSDHDGGSSPVRDIIVWPPGWQPVSEAGVLGQTLVVASTSNYNVYEVSNSTGKSWLVSATHQKNRNNGYIVALTPGTYVSGTAITVFRIPRILVGHAPSRGKSNTGFGILTSQIQHNGLSVASTFRQRTSNVAVIYHSNAGSFSTGQTIVVSGISDPTYNGTFVVTGVNSTYVIYSNTGTNEGLTADTGGRVSLFDLPFYMHFFKAFTPWALFTGPYTGTGTLSEAPQCPFTVHAYLRYGIALRKITVIAKEFQGNPETHGSTAASQVYQVFAPQCTSDTPDFCVDVDLPAYQTMRIVWYKGIPQPIFPASVSTPPYSGATRSNRNRSSLDRLYQQPEGSGNVGDASVWDVGIKEDNGIVRAITCLGSLGRGSTFVIRPSMIPSTNCCIMFGTVNFNNGFETQAPTMTSCVYQWYRNRSSGGPVAVGSPASMPYTLYTYSGGTQSFRALGVISPPVEAARGDNAGGYSIAINAIGVDAYGVAFNTTRNIAIPSYSGGIGIQSNLSPVGEWNPLHPWPWDVPLLAFAANEASVRYAGNTGWLLSTPNADSITITPPTISRAGNTITATSGTATPGDVNESYVPASRSVVINASVVNSAIGGSNGGTIAAGTSVSTTVAGFSGNAVVADAVDTWAFGSSSQNTTFNTFPCIYTAKATAVLP